MPNIKPGPLNTDYMKRMEEIIHYATEAHTRTAVFTFALRLPEYRDRGDTIACIPNLQVGIMERFKGALEARIAVHQHQRRREGLQVCPTDLRVVWVREVGASGKLHYHAAIFVNKDTFNCLGDYSKKDRNLGSYICKAWLSATGLLGYPEYRTLVSFNNTPHILEALREDRFEKQRKQLLDHLSYFAKERTKVYSREARSFGGSVR